MLRGVFIVTWGVIMAHGYSVHLIVLEAELLLQIMLFYHARDEEDIQHLPNSKHAPGTKP